MPAGGSCPQWEGASAGHGKYNSTAWGAWFGIVRNGGDEGGRAVEARTRRAGRGKLSRPVLWRLLQALDVQALPSGKSFFCTVRHWAAGALAR